MSSSYQKVIIVGKLARDPEAKVTTSGTTVSNFTVVTDKKFKDKDGAYKEKAAFHRCKCFGKKADVINQYLKKGSLVCLEGELDYGDYTKDGVKHYTTDIVVSDFTMMGGKPQSGGEGYTAPAPAHASDDYGDESPF